MKSPKSVLVWLGHLHAVQTPRFLGGCGLGRGRGPAIHARTDFPRGGQTGRDPAGPARWPRPRDLRRAGRRRRQAGQDLASQARDPPAQVWLHCSSSGLAIHKARLGAGCRRGDVAAGYGAIQPSRCGPAPPIRARRTRGRTRGTYNSPSHGGQLRHARRAPAPRAAQRIPTVGLRPCRAVPREPRRAIQPPDLNRPAEPIRRRRHARRC